MRTAARISPSLPGVAASAPLHGGAGLVRPSVRGRAGGLPHRPAVGASAAVLTRVRVLV